MKSRMESMLRPVRDMRLFVILRISCRVLQVMKTGSSAKDRLSSWNLWSGVEKAHDRATNSQTWHRCVR